MTYQDKPWIRIGALALAAVLLAPAVPAADKHDGGHGHHGHHGGGHAFDFGAPAPDAEPERTIELVARDTMQFEPSSVSVAAGETVRFVVRNAGQLQHSFTLGSSEYHAHHEAKMQGMAMENMAGHMDDTPHGVVVQPGGTASLTWRFEQGGSVEFACHIPGHYAAGMKGSLRIQ